MKKLYEIINYGDSEPLEIIISLFMIAQLCHPSPSIFCWHAIVPDYYYFLGALSSIGILVGNIFNNLKVRKWSSNLALVVVLGIIIISLYRGVYDIQVYLIFISEFLALFWITWRCSREDVFNNYKTSKTNDE